MTEHRSLPSLAIPSPKASLEEQTKIDKLLLRLSSGAPRSANLISLMIMVKITQVFRRIVASIGCQGPDEMHAQLTGLVVLTLLCGCTDTTPELQCPIPRSGQIQETLGETATQVAQVGERLGRGSENEVKEVAANVRRAHPGATNGAIVNLLVTVYCPRIKDDTSLSRLGKQNALKLFSQRVEKIIGT